MTETIRQIIDEKSDHQVENELNGNNLIPSWSEVGAKFNLNEILSPSEQGLTQDYYRAQKRIAEGRKRKAAKIFKGLDDNIRFVEFEKKESSLLNEIASFVRRPSEKKHQTQ